MKNKTVMERRIQINKSQWEQLLPDDRRWWYLPVAEDNVTDVAIRYNKSSGSEKDVEIPEWIGEYRVRRIGRQGFSFNRELRSVAIPQTVEKIDYGAFAHCENLERVILSRGLKTIDWNVFEGCTVLRTIMLPDGVTRIGNKAFYRCSALESIYIPASVTHIGEDAFSECGGAKGHSVTRTATRPTPSLSSFTSRREMDDYYGPDVAFAATGAPAEALEEMDRELAKHSTYTYTEYVNGGTGRLMFYVKEGSYAHKWCSHRGCQVKFY